MVDLIMGSVCYNISNLSYTDCCCYLVTKSCLTLLCDPMDCSLLGSSVRFSRHTLPWAWLYPFCEAGMLGHLIRPISQQMLLLLLSRFSRVWLCATPETAAHQAPLSLGFSRQEHWSGLPFPSPMHESEKWSRSVVSDPQQPTPWTAAYQAPPSMRFSRQEYWSGVPLTSPSQQYTFHLIWHSVSAYKVGMEGAGEHRNFCP